MGLALAKKAVRSELGRQALVALESPLRSPQEPSFPGSS